LRRALITSSKYNNRQGVEMKNKTKSEIIIKMNHIDNANRLFLFLKKAFKVANMGGDIYFEYDGAEKEKICIGHDVRAVGVEHHT